MPDRGGLTAVSPKDGGEAREGGTTREDAEANRAFVRDYMRRSIEVMKTLPVEEMTLFIDALRDARDHRRQVFLCGNGGSASTASHLAAWLGKDGSRGAEHRFRVVSLTDNIPWMTSLANDVALAGILSSLERNAEAEPLLERCRTTAEDVLKKRPNDLMAVGIYADPDVGDLARIAAVDIHGERVIFEGVEVSRRAHDRLAASAWRQLLFRAHVQARRLSSTYNRLFPPQASPEFAVPFPEAPDEADIEKWSSRLLANMDQLAVVAKLDATQIVD